MAEQPSMTIETELAVHGATVRIVRFALPEPVAGEMTPIDCYRLDHCLTPRPRNARACFPLMWGPHRFEPLGDVFLVPPGHAIHTRGDKGGRQTSVICDVPRARVERWLDRELIWTDRRLEAALDVPSARVRGLLDRLAEEALRPLLARERMIELIAEQLAIEIARFCEAVGDGPVTGGLAAWRLRLIDERLRAAGSPPRLEELARLCGLSVRQLTRGFRASRGCSVSACIERGRIESAKRLLAGTESVKSIAFATGFASPSSFSSAFRRVTGTTPRAFRQHESRPRR